MLQSCAQMLPSRCAGIGPVGRHDVAVLLAQLHPHVGMQRDVERPHLLPQPIDFLRERRRPACRTSAATSRRCRRSPAPSRRCSRARRSAGSRLRIGTAMVCQPSHTSRSRARVARRRHDLGDLLDVEARLRLRRAPCTTCRGRTWPRVVAASVVSSSAAFGSDGVDELERDLQQVELAALVGPAARRRRTARRPWRTARPRRCRPVSRARSAPRCPRVM